MADGIIITPPQEQEIAQDVVSTEQGESFNAEGHVVTSPKDQVVNTITVDEVKKLIKEGLISVLPKLGLRLQKVDELPTTGENGIIYMVPISDGSAPNLYEEYYWIDGNPGSFESLGTTEVQGFVDLTSAQTITGVKTFSNGIKIGDQELKETGGGANLELKPISSLIINASYFRPFTTNSLDLGTSSIAWKDIYLAGSLKSPTNYLMLNNNYGNVGIYNTSNNIIFDISSDGSLVTINSALRPRNNGAGDLGTTNNKFKDLYLSGGISTQATGGASSIQLKFWKGTQAQYDSLVSGGTVDANTLYIIV